MVNRRFVGAGQQVAARPEEDELLGAADVQRRHRVEDRLIGAGRVELRAGVDLRVVARIEPDVEAPEIAVEIADVSLADEPRIRGARRHRIRLQCVLHLFAAGRVGTTVVNGLVQTIAADVRAREQGAVLRTDDVERRPGDFATAVRVLLRRIREKPRPEQYRIWTGVGPDLADGGIGPGLADSLLDCRSRCADIAVGRDRRIEVGIFRERPVQRDFVGAREVTQQRVHIVAGGRHRRRHIGHRDVERLVERAARTFADQQQTPPHSVDFDLSDLRRTVDEVIELIDCLPVAERPQLRDIARGNEIQPHRCGRPAHPGCGPAH